MGVECARCGRPILAATDWQLDHAPGKTSYLGPRTRVATSLLAARKAQQSRTRAVAPLSPSASAGLVTGMRPIPAARRRCPRERLGVHLLSRANGQACTWPLRWLSKPLLTARSPHRRGLPTSERYDSSGYVDSSSSGAYVASSTSPISPPRNRPDRRRSKDQ
jgi:hypothetical protein